ncbi:DUF6113 family protein [Streptomyces sp. NPDC018031]|uniref:DUF6113 family protein n=1 Tax=Streptomyces sp. NPDC018031 TaxID=3365033 RepID=UPI0037BDB80B
MTTADRSDRARATAGTASAGTSPGTPGKASAKPSGKTSGKASAGTSGKASAGRAAGRASAGSSSGRGVASSGRGAGGARPGGSGSGPGAGARPGGAAPVPPGGGALALRIGGYLFLAVLGVLTGIAGALVQAAWFPGGLLLALLGLMALTYGGVQLTRTRLGGVVPAVGWAVVVLFLTASRPEGDFVFTVGAGSYVFLLGGMVVGVMCATMSKVPQPGGSTARLGK